MKKIILLALFVPYFYHSQIKTELEVFGNSRGSVFDVTNQNIKSYSGIDGSPYLDEFFHPISIDGYNKTLPAVRYNAYEDEMEFEINGKTNYIVKNQNVKINFPDNNKTYVLTRYQLEDKEINGYLVILVNEGKYKLYKKETVELLVNQNNKNIPYLNEKPPVYERNKDIFLILYNGKFYKVQKNWKEIAKELSVDNSKLNDFIKKNKISVKDEGDLIRLVEFLNK